MQTRSAAAEVGAAEETPAVNAVSDTWRMALAVCAALLVALVPLDSAQAARSGGRMGGFGGGMRMGGFGGGGGGMRGQAPRMNPQMRGGPRFSGGPNVSIGVGPMLAPPLFGPSLLAPSLFGPPMLPVPVPSMGPSVSDQLMQDQQRRDERQIDTQKAQIDALQKEIAELKAKRQ